LLRRQLGAGVLGAWEGCTRPQRPAARVPVYEEKEGREVRARAASPAVPGTAAACA